MTIIIGWAHVGFKYFSFILGLGFPVLSEHPVRHGLPYSHWVLGAHPGGIESYRPLPQLGVLPCDRGNMGGSPCLLRFVTTSASVQSLDGSDYSALDNNVTTEAENSDNSEIDGQAAAPVEELQDIQRLYSVFLPSHLQSKEKTWEKCQKM